METFPEGEEPPSLVIKNVATGTLMILSTSTSNFMVAETAYLLLFVMLLIVGSALMSGSEVAFFSLNRQQTDDLEKERTASAIRISRLLNNPHDLLATILIVNNLFNIAIILSLHLLTHKVLANISPILQILIEVGLITFVLVLFGEIIPKVYANYFNLKTARFMSLIIGFFKLLFYPLVKILVGSTSFIEKRMSKKLGKISADDIDQAIGLISETHDNEKELLKRVIDFSNIMASEIMTNRTQVTYVKVSDSFQEIFEVFLETGFSRIPVCEEDLDDVKGFIYAKDLLKYEARNKEKEWHQLIREPFFVLESTKLDKLLEDFKNKRKHIALVVDEYGGSCGVVTLEDVLEEVVGEIDEEIDIKSPDSEAVFVGKNMIVEGVISILDLSRILKVNHNDFNELRGESDTLAGMLLEIKGAFLEVGESLDAGNYTFTILSKEENKIGEVKVDLIEKKQSKLLKKDIVVMNKKEERKLKKVQ